MPIISIAGANPLVTVPDSASTRSVVRARDADSGVCAAFGELQLFDIEEHERRIWRERGVR